ncbi:MAG: Flp pilus assembly complex ATPase component TadA [Magnetococcales bacterium]|nr:Flp pilus assembly complex ATPase component TadA [Magnetococcales bacterium]
MLVRSRIISSSQRDEALTYQEQAGIRLGDGLVELGYLSQAQLLEFLQRQRSKNRVGERLVEAGMITEAQLTKALDDQRKTGSKLGQSLDRLGILAEKNFLTFLAKQLSLAFVDLTSHPLQPELVRQLPETVARRFRAVVLQPEQKGLLIGMSDPTDLFAYDQLVKTLKTPLYPALISERSLLRIFDLSYRQADHMGVHVARLEEEVGEYKLNQPGEEEQDAPVVRIIQSLFEDAVRLKASDIHIEPDADVLRVRQRVDGELMEQVIKEKRIAPALVSKLKLMAGIEIAEKRLPQDGRFQVTVKGQTIDVRLSTLPIQDGESVVLRLLDQSGDNLNLEQIGMEPSLLARFRRQIGRSQGLILVTGPTGSGKTTTLYGALNALNVPGRKIITIEEPVEYRLPRINQVQVRPKIGLTYESILRTVLRQDPDILLVGEMRDQETSKLAIQAALTGHLVFASLHTISAVSTTVRLIEMGLPGYAVAAALRCVLAQRLVRRVCQSCARSRGATDREQELIRRQMPSWPKPIRFKEGRGCAHCNQSGFQGRVAVVELLEMNGSLTEALRREDLGRFVAQSKKQADFAPLHLSALEHAMAGIICPADAFRFVAEAQEAHQPYEERSGVDDGKV